jgi:hypothetical protein
MSIVVMLDSPNSAGILAASPQGDTTLVVEYRTGGAVFLASGNARK